MVCYLHPDREAVVTCGNCGVAMCSECEAKALYRTDNGKGKPLCYKCGLQAAQDNVSSQKSWLTKRLVKLIISGVFVIIGLAVGIGQYSSGNGKLGFFLAAIIPWAIAGFIGNLGAEKPQQSISDGLYEYKHPLSSTIIKIIVSAIFAPIVFIFNFIGYYRTYSSYKQEISNLNLLQAEQA